jgi:aspartate aminotransferase
MARRAAEYRTQTATVSQIAAVAALEGPQDLLAERCGTSGDDLVSADALLEAGCAGVPGSAFGAPGHLRLSFATDTTALDEGCRVIVDTLDGISA